jgi:hypothetical protein
MNALYNVFWVTVLPIQARHLILITLYNRPDINHTGLLT